MGNCCETVPRVSFLVVNIICAIFGLILIVTGLVDVIGFTYYSDYLYIAPNYYNESINNFNGAIIIEFAVVLMILGLLLVVNAIFGYFGAAKESYQIITTYACIMIFLIIMQLYIAIRLHIYEPEISVLARTAATGLFSDINGNIEDINAVQQNFECCGINSVNDWGKIPDSCNDYEGRIFRKGCERGFEIFIRIGLYSIVTVASLAIIIEVIAVVFGFYVGNDIRNQKRNRMLINHQTANFTPSHRGDPPQDV